MDQNIVNILNLCSTDYFSQGYIRWFHENKQLVTHSKNKKSFSNMISSLKMIIYNSEIKYRGSWLYQDNNVIFACNSFFDQNNLSLHDIFGNDLFNKLKK